jgi:acetyl-CoA carboxylase biotin carboxyl carrier protein
VELTSDDVQDILRVLDGLPYEELHLETARFRLSLRRSAAGAGWTQSMEVLTAPSELAAADGAGAAVAETAAPVQRAAEPAADGADAAGGSGLTDVRAPLLGTFYRAPRPGAPPFVEVGSPVAPDTVVCIIETMKLMNSVTAGASGTIAQILVENAQFADQGTVLMRIRQE